MVYYDFRPFGIIMDSFPYTCTRREVFSIINEAPAAFHPIMRLSQYFQHPLVECIEEFVQPFPYYLGKSLIIHLNEIKEGKWIGMIFTTQLDVIFV